MNLRSFTHPAAALAALMFSLLSLPGCNRAPEAAPKGPMAADVQQSSPPIIAVMETDKGTIEIELMPSVAPKTVENFRLLTERGYYNGLTFHRIVKGFMIQGGDPKGDGRGGESAWGGTFEDEIDKTSGLYREGYKRGSVAMANSGPNTNTSQFFIVHQDYPLHPGYTIFGKVIKGIEVVDELANTPTTAGPMTSEKSKPVTPPVMKKVYIKK